MNTYTNQPSHAANNAVLCRLHRKSFRFNTNDDNSDNPFSSTTLFNVIVGRTTVGSCSSGSGRVVVVVVVVVVIVVIIKWDAELSAVTVARGTSERPGLENEPCEKEATSTGHDTAEQTRVECVE